MKPAQLQQDAQKLLPYIEAMARGKTVEYMVNSDGEWHSVDRQISLFYLKEGVQVRIKPEPTAENYLTGHKLSGLKVGDKVRVERLPKCEENGWIFDGCLYGDSLIGSEHEIIQDRGEDRYGFYLAGIGWFPHFVLSKVTPKLRDMREDDFDGMPVIWVDFGNGGGQALVIGVQEDGFRLSTFGQVIPWHSMRMYLSWRYSTTRLKDDWNKFEREEA